MQKVKFKKYSEDGDRDWEEVGSLIHIDRETAVMEFDEAKIPVDRVVFFVLGIDRSIYRVDPEDIRYIDVQY